MKVKASWKNDLLVFTNVAVKKESDHFYGVYKYVSYGSGTIYGEVITSAPTLNAAAKKAKMIEIGYKMGVDEMNDCYCWMHDPS